MKHMKHKKHMNGPTVELLIYPPKSCSYIVFYGDNYSYEFIRKRIYEKCRVRELDGHYGDPYTQMAPFMALIFERDGECDEIEKICHTLTENHFVLNEKKEIKNGTQEIWRESK